MGYSKKKLIVLGLVCILGLLLVTGCGKAKSGAMSSDTIVQMDSESANQFLTKNSSMMASGSTNQYEGETYHDTTKDNIERNDSGQKLIKSIQFEVETDQFDTVFSNIESQVTVLGGYIENLYTSYQYRNNIYGDLRVGNLTIRIPVSETEKFIKTFDQQVHILSRSESVQDITLTYVDLESNKKAILTEQKRLLELLENAADVSDIITIEQRLSEVRYQLNSMESQLRTFDNKIDYTTIDLTINEIEGTLTLQKQTTVDRIGEGFVTNVKRLGRGIVNFFVFLLINLPFIFTGAVLIYIIVLVVRKIRTGKFRKEISKRDEEKNE